MCGLKALVLLCLFSFGSLATPLRADVIEDGRYVVVHDHLPLQTRQKRLFGYTILSAQAGQLTADYMRPALDPPKACSWQSCLDAKRIFTAAVDADPDTLRLGEAVREEGLIIDTAERDGPLYVEPLHDFLNGASVTARAGGYLLEKDGVQMTLAPAQPHVAARSLAYLQTTQLNAHGFDYCVLRQMLDPNADALRGIMAVEVERQTLPVLAIQAASQANTAAELKAQRTVFLTLPTLRGTGITTVAELRDQANARFGSTEGYQAALDALMERHGDGLIDWLAFQGRLAQAFSQGGATDEMIARICEDALLQ